MIEKIALAFDKKEKKKMISPLPLQGASGNRVCPWPRDLKTKVHHRSTPRRRLFMFWRLAARRRSLPSSDAWARRSRHRCSAAAAAASIRQVNPCLTAHVSPCMRHRRSRCRVSPFATIHSVRGVTCSRSSSSPPSRRSYVLPNDARPRRPHLKSVGPRRGLLTVL
jgi:hypothetical protein